MSLDFKLDKIENYEELCWESTGEFDTDGEEFVRIKNDTNIIIWATITLGLNRITEKNLVEWATRWKMALGAGMVGRNITIQNLRDHIGLSTNASPLTMSRFNTKLYKWVKEDMEVECAN